MTRKKRAEFGRSWPRFAIALGMVAAAAGCADLPGARLGDTHVVQNFLETPITGESYTDHLAAAYQLRALEERAQDTSWHDSIAFFRKGRAAMAGEPVRPWDPAVYGLGDYSPLKHGHQRTRAATARNAALRPAACAQMVARFDAWLEAAREAEAVSDEETLSEIRARGSWSAAYVACANLDRITVEDLLTEAPRAPRDAADMLLAGASSTGLNADGATP